MQRENAGDGWMECNRQRAVGTGARGQRTQRAINPATSRQLSCPGGAPSSRPTPSAIRCRQKCGADALQPPPPPVLASRPLCPLCYSRPLCQLSHPAVSFESALAPWLRWTTGQRLLARQGCFAWRLLRSWLFAVNAPWKALMQMPVRVLCMGSQLLLGATCLFTQVPHFALLGPP